ncbi:GGDEF domain-containing protein [uncultured Jannaschia sp.]|uniref:GGDEF domain-containing protein n=1 Tax=uncultured Jannaschia sp. TaxID=293347 RepID=UPI002635FA8C|nr:GGDEF domain-containing protein [uncultured Jannaschia sp.]
MTEMQISVDALDALLPLAIAFDAEGRVDHVGPTIEKMAPGGLGRPLAEIIRLRRPDRPVTVPCLLADTRRRHVLELRLERSGAPDLAPTRLRGLVVGRGDGGGVIRLGLGTTVAETVARHDLTVHDFATTDPTIELLFVMEAQRAILTEFRRLDRRIEEARQRAARQAETDRLTGLRNRRAMDSHLERLIQNPGAGFGLMQLDLDHFKAVNDTLGHAAGDRVLEEVARILGEETRKADMVARIGGDEFILLIADCADPDLLRTIAERIIARLGEPIDWHGTLCHISGSIGVTLSRDYDAPAPARMMADADAALYASKNAGRARVSFAAPSATPN